MKGWLWLVQMAWRDSRRGRARLVLFMTAMSIGIGGLVAIRSFQDSIRTTVDRQAGELLGADLAVNSRRPFTRTMQEMLARTPGEVSLQRNMSTMLRFGDSSFSRLVRLRAVSPGFPYYGRFETVPANADKQLQRGAYVLVDDGLMRQSGAEVGDTVEIGKASFVIAGRLLRVPGEIAIWGELSPRVFISYEALEDTGLIQAGSRVFYRALMRIPEAGALHAFTAELREIEQQQGIRVETIDSRQERLGQTLSNVYRFLDIFAIAALLLGAIGVGSAVHVYIRQKLHTVAILRCLGASCSQTLWIYLLQMLAIGLLGTVAGVVLGMVVQQALPAAMAGLVPERLEVTWSRSAVMLGLIVGMGVTAILTALPLLSVRRISPMAAFRTSIEPPPSAWRDPLRMALWCLSGVGLYLLVALALRNWSYGALFTGGLLLLFGLLAGGASLLIWVVRRCMPRRMPFFLRQGLNNLYRPNNQTPILMMCLGLGSFLFALLFAIQYLLLAQIAWSHDSHAPNLLLFDIQTDELTGVREVAARYDLGVMQEAPIVTMRLHSISGIRVPELRERTEPEIDGWALNREYRSSYRGHLTEGEKIIAGTFVQQVDAHTAFEIPVPISIEKGIAETLFVGLGDEIVFDIQGLPITTYVASIRTVDWYQLRPNFFVIFPIGVLEDAPQNHMMAARVSDPEVKGQLQQELMRTFPTVSLIDADSLIQTLDSVFSKLSFAVRFMSLFSVGAGLLVLVGAVATSRYQRLRESTLLRTIGASRRQILLVTGCEFALLGAFASLTGTVLALAASWGLARFWFETSWLIALWPLVGLWVLVSLLTVVVGLANARQTLRVPPLELLRQQPGD